MPDPYHHGNGNDAKERGREQSGWFRCLKLREKVIYGLQEDCRDKQYLDSCEFLCFPEEPLECLF